MATWPHCLTQRAKDCGKKMPKRLISALLQISCTSCCDSETVGDRRRMASRVAKLGTHARVRMKQAFTVVSGGGGVCTLQ